MEAAPIRLVIADDMAPIREYLSMVLGHESDMQILAAVGTGAEAVEYGMKLQPDVFLMDIEMETANAGVEAIRRLSISSPRSRSVVLTHFSNDSMVFAAFEAGAVDYILKDSSVSELLEAVRAAAHEMSPLRPQVAKMIRSEFRILRSERAALVNTLNIVYRLTPTELNFLQLLAEGKTKQEIAELRHVEASTIRTHVGNILKKFDEETVDAVVEQLKRLGIFEIFERNASLV